MDALQRREEILTLLRKATTPISARELAKVFSVSRQIIVGDVALLRAEGHAISAGAQGYIFGIQHPNKLRKIVAVQHSHDQTKKELELFVSLGIIVEDVIVEHPVYGELRGNLNIQTKEDIVKFMNDAPPLLSSLTSGIHLHTVLVEDERQFLELLKSLEHNGFSINNHEVS